MIVRMTIFSLTMALIVICKDGYLTSDILQSKTILHFSVLSLSYMSRFSAVR